MEIWLNAAVIEHVGEEQLLEQPDGRLGFYRELNEEEAGPGMKLIRVFALQQNGELYAWL